MQKKKHSRVVLIAALLFFVPVIAVPFVVSIASEVFEQAPTLFVDWLTSKAKSWFNGLFDDTDEKVDEWITTYYPSFSGYSSSTYPQLYLAEAISLYQYVNTGEDISTRLVSMDEYMEFFKNSDQRTVFSKLSVAIDWNISDEDSETIYKYAAAMEEYVTLYPSSVESTISVDYESDGTVVGNAMAWAISIAENDSYGYSQIYRQGNPDYDCSSLVTNAYIYAGVKLDSSDNTSLMYSDYPSHGFVRMGFTGEAALQPGDVLWRAGHTEMYIGNGYQVGAHTNVAGNGVVYAQGGDQFDNHDWNSYTGEISVTPYNDNGWTLVFRYVGG